MNKILKFLFAAALFVPFASCGGNDDPDPAPKPGSDGIKVSQETVEISAEGSEVTLEVKSTAGSWTAYATDVCKSWVSARILDWTSTEGHIKLVVGKNDTKAEREGEVVIKAGSSMKSVKVIQSAPLQVSTTQINSRSAGAEFEVTIGGSLHWEVSVSDAWIKATKVNDTTLKVVTEANDSPEKRTGTVEVKSGAESIAITVIQDSNLDREIVAPEGYTLVWHDEFDSGSRLGSDWRHEVQSAGWVNNELQNYVNGEKDGIRVTEISNGVLRITAFKNPKDGKVYSARVYAKDRQGWLYGYFEARIKLPKGKGTWPAWWMMPVGNDWNTNPWPKCGEIDIMEEVGYHPNYTSSSIHCQAFNHTIGTQKTHEQFTKNAEDEFHTYAVEWTEKQLKFYVDGNVHFTFSDDGKGHDHWPFHYAFYPILNLAWGGMWGGAQGVDESALPATMEVDYVRIFQKQ